MRAWEVEALKRAEWWSKLTVGDKFVLGWRSHGSTAQPYLVLTISRMTGSNVFATSGKGEWRFRRSDARLIFDGRIQFAEPYDDTVRQVLQDHELRTWIGYSAEQQILKLTKAQQLALKSLVNRMAADTAVLS